MEQARAAAAALAVRLREYAGVVDARDDASLGKDEIVVRPGFGAAAGAARRDDVRVLVRYAEDERRSLDSLGALRVPVPARPIALTL